MKIRLMVMLALLGASLQGHAQSGSGYADDMLPGLQTNVVRAQLVPLQKGLFSSGISAIVEQIKVQEGQAVKRGDLMLSFDCDGIEASGTMSEARLKIAQATLEVNRELLELNSVGPLEVKLNEADVEVAQGELAAVTAKLKHCEIRAPFSGVITMRAVDAFQFVAEGEAMLELVSKDRLEVRLLMPSTSLVWLKVGSEFNMLVEELNDAMPGNITRIGGAVDPVSLTVPVFGKLEQDNDRLLPGMSGRVQFVNVEYE